MGFGPVWVLWWGLALIVVNVGLFVGCADAIASRLAPTEDRGYHGYFGPRITTVGAGLLAKTAA